MRPSGILIVIAAAFLPVCVRAQSDEVARAFVPSAHNIHGEVRVLANARSVCVQSLLYSRMLARGLQAIRTKEAACWPDGNPDSARYLSSLRDAETRIMSTFYANTNRTDERQKMLIEFQAFPDHGHVRICELEIDETNGAVGVRSSPELSSFDTSLSYVQRSMRQMIRNAFPEIPDTLKPVLSALAGDDPSMPGDAVPLHE